MAPIAARLFVTLTALLTLVACTSESAGNADKTPSGVAAHQASATASAAAAQRGGACTLVTVSDLRQALGGTVGPAVPDALTPGLDQCRWQLSRSRAGASASVVVYLPPDQTLRAYDEGRHAARHPITLHGVGIAAYYEAITRTLVVDTGHHVAGLQIVTPVTISHTHIQLQQPAVILARAIARRLR